MPSAALYEELGITGEVLDLMGSWVSHFRVASGPADRSGDERATSSPRTLRLAAAVVHDLNADPGCRFPTRRSTPWCAASPSTT